MQARKHDLKDQNDPYIIFGVFLVMPFYLLTLEEDQICTQNP